MGAKYDGGTNAICWNVDIIANEKLTSHINFCPPVGWIRLCLVESLMEIKIASWAVGRIKCVKNLYFGSV